MKQTINDTMQHGYAHHIPRLMVTGMFGILAEINPCEVEACYLAVYVDAVEWVALPNMLVWPYTPMAAALPANLMWPAARRLNAWATIAVIAFTSQKLKLVQMLAQQRLYIGTL